MKKVLFVGGGRRVELAHKFWNRDYEIFSYELFDNVPISSVATVIKGLPWKSKNIMKHLTLSILTNEIDLVLPLMDEGVVVCSKLPASVKDRVLAPSTKTAETCYDKLQFAYYMMEHFDWVYPSFDDSLPAIAKPQFGFGSTKVTVIRHQCGFERLGGEEMFVLQKYIEGTEYSVDSYFDRDSNWIDSVPRERTRVAGGEVVSSKTVDKPLLAAVTQIVGEHLGLVGPANLQFIQQDDGKFYLIEINARFGGGWTFSMEAGLDAITLIEGGEYKSNEWKREMKLERSFRDHYYET